MVAQSGLMVTPSPRRREECTQCSCGACLVLRASGLPCQRWPGYLDQKLMHLPVGFWCSAGLEVPCAPNTYQPEPGQLYAGSCTMCPRFAESPSASDRINNCTCMAQYYDSEPSSGLVSCKPCTAGTDGCPTNSTTKATLTISRGWYRTSSSSVDLRQCPDGSRQESGCVGGIGNEGPCKSWLTGPYCRLCNVTDGSRYYDKDASACLACDEGAAAGRVATVVCLVLAAISAVARSPGTPLHVRTSTKVN